MSCKSVAKSDESVARECPTRAFYKSVSYKSVSYNVWVFCFSSTCLHSGSWVPFFQTDFKHGAGIKQDAALESSVMELSLLEVGFIVGTGAGVPRVHAVL